MKKVILLNGLPRSGKDTCADYLVSKHGYTKVSFASTMKEIVATTFGISVDALERMKNDNTIIHTLNGSEVVLTFRDVLQRFGSEAMKPVFGNDVWARTLYDKIHTLKTDKIVVSDFRFLIEYQPQDGLDLETWLINDGRELPIEGHASDVELYANGFTFDKSVFNKDKSRTTSLKTYHARINNALKGYEDAK